ncbi:hypothetical protein [Oryzicola mucosus]
MINFPFTTARPLTAIEGKDGGAPSRLRIPLQPSRRNSQIASPS